MVKLIAWVYDVESSIRLAETMMATLEAEGATIQSRADAG